MIVAIHQPHFIPWLGYLDRMARADLFILLDHVQFERQNYQNRVRIKTGQGPQWLTVPVLQASREERILEKRIEPRGDGRHDWTRRAWLTLQYAYQGAPFFDEYAPALRGLLEARYDRLVDLNAGILDFLRSAFDIRTPMIRSSELAPAGQRSDLVLDLCQRVDADAFLGGLGGSRSYLDERAFARAGIEVLWQRFEHPRYAQHPRPAQFVEGLAAIDLLFNCGPDSGAVLRGSANELAQREALYAPA